MWPATPCPTGWNKCSKATASLPPGSASASRPPVKVIFRQAAGLHLEIGLPAGLGQGFWIIVAVPILPVIDLPAVPRLITW
jgi:hypothetical protein